MGIRRINKISTYNRYRLLQRAVFHPEHAPDWLLCACRSQQALAALHVPDAALYPLSKNAMQKAAEEVVDGGGWKKFDELRRVLKGSGDDSQARRRHPRRSNRRELTQHIVALEKHLRRLERERVRLKHAYYELLMVVSDRARSDSRLCRKLRTYAQEYGPEWMTTVVHQSPVGK